MANWSPSDLQNGKLVGWYDCSDTSTIVSAGNAVYIWKDKSDQKNDLVQDTIANRPLYAADTINSINVITFDGSNDILQSLKQPFEDEVCDAAVFIVAIEKSRKEGTIFSLTGTETGANRWQAHCPFSDGNIYFDCGGTGVPNRITGAIGVATGTAFQVCFRNSIFDAVQSFWVNGALIATDASGETAATNGYLRLGSGGTYYQNAAVGEVLVLKGGVTDSERHTIEGYLKAKWGLSALPAGHDFGSATPTVDTPSKTSVYKDWPYRQSITIDHTKVPGTLTNFTMKLTQHNFCAAFKDSDSPFCDTTDGGPTVRFTSDAAGATPLAFHAHKHQPNATATSANIVYYVKLPTVSSSDDTVFYVWWGRTGETVLAATNTYGRNNAYKSGWKFASAGYSSGTTYYDYTSNNQNGTKLSATSPTYAHDGNGSIHQDTQVFNGSTSYITLWDFSPTSATQFTALLEFKTTSTNPTGWQRLLSKKNAYNDANGWEINRIQANNTQIQVLGSSSTEGTLTIDTSIGDGNWNILTVKFNGTTTSGWTNGASKGTATITAVSDNALLLTVGDNSNHTETNFSGTMGQIWLYDGLLDDNEIVAMQNNWTAPDTFATAGIIVLMYDSRTTIPGRVKQLARLTGTIANASASTVVALGMTVDTTKSIMRCTTRVDNADPQNYCVRSVFTSLSGNNSSEITLYRYSTTGTLSYVLEVVEFESGSGITVEHGSFTRVATTDSITLSRPFNRDRSWILLSQSESGTAYSSNDPIMIRFTNTNTIEIASVAVDTNQIVAYQNIEYDYANVQSNGNSTWSGNSVYDSLRQVIVAKSFVCATGYDTGGGNLVGTDLYRLGMDSTAIFGYSYSGVTADSISWFAVEFVDHTFVDRYSQTFSSSQTNLNVTTTQRRTDRTICFNSSVFLPLTSTNDATDAAGPKSFTIEKTAETTLNCQRAIHGSVESILSIQQIAFLSSDMRVFDQYYRKMRQGV